MTLTAVINPVVPLNLLFPHQRVICPQSRQSAEYIIVTHNFTNDDLTDGDSPSYQGYSDQKIFHGKQIQRVLSFSTLLLLTMKIKPVANFGVEYLHILNFNYVN